jgi:hypothetical protein
MKLKKNMNRKWRSKAENRRKMNKKKRRKMNKKIRRKMNKKKRRKMNRGREGRTAKNLPPINQSLSDQNTGQASCWPHSDGCEERFKFMVGGGGGVHGRRNVKDTNP